MMTASNRSWACLIGLLGLILAGCQQVGSCKLKILFPDDEARALVRTLEVWVVPGGEADCSALTGGTARPGDPGLEVMNHLRLSYPPPVDADGLDPVAVGPAAFYAEGRGAGEEIFLRGCSVVQVPPSATIEVVIELNWTCRPVAEECGNGLDDNCDGQIDEGCLECEQDSDCDDLRPCTIDFCTNHECHQANFPLNTACTDDDPCTLGDACDDQGQCLGQHKDCTAFDGPCNLGRCEPLSGECGPHPKDDGTACDDGKWCSEKDACAQGVCLGEVRNCDDGDPCTDDPCAEGEQQCLHIRVPVPGAEGPPGDATCTNAADDDCDGDTDESDPNCLVCTTNIDCDDDNPCTEDICLGLECNNRFLEDGSACSDNQFCTIGDACLAGVCTGAPRDCNVNRTACKEGVCLEDEDRCETRDQVDGTWCDDGAWCSEGDQCQAGTCLGTQRSCQDGVDCTADTCNEGNNTCDHVLVPVPDAEGLDVDDSCTNSQDDDCDGLVDLDDPDCVECANAGDCDDGKPCTVDSCLQARCVNEATADGTVCDDGSYCTVDDECQAGLCAGGPRDCTGLSEQCHEGVCSEAEQSCVAQVQGDGSACDDGFYCSVSDQCLAGVCAGLDRDCDDDDACTLDTCDDGSNQCSHLIQPNPGAEGPAGHGNCQNQIDDDCDGATDLDDGDCTDCLVDAECNDNNPCTGDSCTLGVCENQALANGSVCNDGFYCTVADTCQAAACEGAARDCSGGLDACHVGSCDEGADSCISSPKPDNTLCDDGNWCSFDDSCSAGVCVGSARNCAHLSDACHDGVCDEAVDECHAQQKADGSPCEDGLWCSEDDRCAAGLCLGSDKDCDDGDGCTIDSCDEANARCDNALNPQGTEGQPGQPACLNALDDDCDALTDLEDPDCSNCGIDADCDDSNPCTADSCSFGLCLNDPGPRNGNQCDDGLWCTVADRCSDSVCNGNLRDCDEYDETCGNGVCDLQTDQCVVQALADGTACDTGLYCQTGETCQAGLCAGGTERDCSDLDPCTVDACHEADRTCRNVFTERPQVLDFCGDGIDQDCDGLTDGCCLSEGSYTIASTTPIGPGAWFMVAADLSQDGMTDLLTINRGDDTLSVLLTEGGNGRGDGTFQVHTYDLGSDPWGLAAGDLDGDHALDVVSANNGAGSVTIYWGQGGGALGERQDLAVAAGTQAVVLADFNGDHILDMATANSIGNNLGILLGQGANGKGNRSFSPASFYNVGASVTPRSLTSGDFNSDGIIDLAVANFSGGSGKDVSVFLGGGADGRGDGTFSATYHYEAGSGVVNIVTADFNADGILDLALTAMSSNAITVLLGQGADGRGAGTFGSRTAYSTGDNSWPVSAFPADLDGDGILDLAVAEWGTNAAGVLWGNGSGGRGDGSFGAKSSYPVGSSPSAAVVLDATGDGLLDLATCNNGSGNLSLLEAAGSSGLGDGTFVLSAVVATGPSPQAMVLDDLNADTILDIAVLHEGAPSVGVYGGQGNDGRGNGEFLAAWSVATGDSPRWLRSADMDGDRIPDLIVANAGDGQVGIFVAEGDNARGSGSFAGQITYAAGTTPVAVGLADLDDDQISDLIALDQAGSLAVRLGDGLQGVPTGSFGPLSTSALTGNPAGFALGDLNEDGWVDLIVAASASDQVHVLLGDGAGGFNASPSVQVDAEPVHVLLLDLDADGSLDMVVANRTAATMSIRLGLGDGSFEAGTNIPLGAGPVMLAAGDFNQDGLIDLASANQSGASISVLLNQGAGAFSAAADLSLGGEPSAVVAGHLDWDGRLDLAVIDKATDAILILRGRGVCSLGN